MEAVEERLALLGDGLAATVAYLKEERKAGLQI
jgi:hypothetical protein